LRHFTASDGVRIAYRDEGAGRPILLLHGLMAHGGFFDAQRPLANDFRLITLDLRGHGASMGRGLRPTVARIAQDIEELSAHLGLEDVLGVGWSLGASVLWRLLAGSAAHRFAGAVVVDMTPCVQNDGDWTLGLSPDHCAQRSAAIRQDFLAFAATAGRAIFTDPDQGSSSNGDWAITEFQKNDPLAIETLWESLASEDYRGGLGAITQPVLIVHGAHSHLYGSATADYLAAAIPNSRRVQFDQSGHTPHMEQPDLFNQVIQDFAASLPQATEIQTAY